MKMIKLMFLFSLVIFQLLLVNGQVGRSKVKIGNDFFDQMVGLITKTVLEQVNNHSSNIPDVDMNFKLAKLIPINASLKNFTYSEIPYVKDQFSINHQGENIVSLKLTKLNLKASTLLEYKIWFLSKHLNEINIDMDISAEIKLKMGVNNKKYFSISLDSLSLDHNFNKFSYKGSYLINFLVGHIGWFKSIINSTLKKAISVQLENVLSSLDANLQKDISIPFLNSTVNLKMENDIQFTSEFFELDLNLDINDMKEEKELRFLQSKPTHKRMLSTAPNEAFQISLDSNLINKLSHLLFKKDRSISISNDSIPKDLPFKINTLYFSSLIPAIYKQYPNQDLVITLDLDSFPLVALDSATNLLNLDLNLAMTFALKSSPDQKIFTLSSGISIGLAFDGSKEDSTIHVSIKQVLMNDIFVVLSTIDISADTIKSNFNTFVSSLIFFANNYLRVNPIPLPIIKGLKFDSINIAINSDNFLEVRCKPDLSLSQFKWIK